MLDPVLGGWNISANKQKKQTKKSALMKKFMWNLSTSIYFVSLKYKLC